MTTWVDSHCHLQLAREAPERLLERAPHVEWIVVPGTDARTSAAALDLADRFAGRVVATVGVHPDAAGRWETDRSAITEMAPRAAAIGETGLDFFRDRTSREVQIAAFRDQLELAVTLDKPVVVHCRDAFRELFRIIRDTNTGDRVILHCWTGGPQWTYRFLGLGVAFSFSNPVVFGSDDMLRRGAALVPPELAMVETDTPHFCPIPGGTDQNEPARVGLVGAALAAVWHTTCEEVARKTSETARVRFRRQDAA